MSRETSEWLNTRVLVGFTAKRGNAWHYRKDVQGDESNHYKGAIPVADVIRRLFNFTVEERALFIPSPDGNEYRVIDGRKAMVTSDTNDVLGIFKESYTGHDYKEWLVDSVATILDDTLKIGSAGLLRNRAQAFVTVEVPDNITTPEGVEFRPTLLACTSFDGSLATTYKRCITRVVCDNTQEMALSEAGQQYKIKHSKYSGMKLTDAREALAVVHTMADDFAREVAALCSWEVTDKQFDKHLNVLYPVPDDEGRGRTVAEKKHEEIMHLYRADDRAKPWQGTAFGVLQAHNTWYEHYSQVRKVGEVLGRDVEDSDEAAQGLARSIRIMENVVTDKVAAFDKNILTTLAKVARPPKELVLT